MAPCRAILGFVLSVCLAVITSGSVNAQTVLRVTLQVPLTNVLGANLVAFQEEVEKASKGELKVEIYPSSQLYKDREVPQAVASGAIEMGTTSLAQLSGTIPAVDVLDVPFLFPDPTKVERATAPGSPVRAPLDEAILKTGARPLWWQAFGGAILVSKKPIRRPEDMKGLKVRTYGKIPGEFLRAVGAAPTIISGSEQFLAYQRGTVDAGLTGTTSVQSRRLYEVMDYLTLANIGAVEFVVLINEKFWQNLPEPHRRIIAAAAAKVEKDLRSGYSEIEKGAIEFIRARTKMKIVELSNEEVAAWREATKSVVDAFVEHAGPLGAQVVKAAQGL
ncbi:MAG: TRAP transporter substrate-binding protein DctP [Anaerolineae bacterium]|jgi:C4-dicarboxylate-binding protein DctP|nr:TRAP transporter substrate-binding protein DctP [Anaerolineae bacterium]